MNRYIVFLTLILMVFPVYVLAENKKVYGVFENVSIPELGISVIKAKLDTGAVTTSLGADNIELFKKDGEDWVRFKPQTDKPFFVERPLVRYSNIKLRMSESDSNSSSQRPVIMLNICFNGTLYPVEVNLTDRDRFNYPLLIGRNALVDFEALIDPSLKYQADKGCK